MSASQPVNFGYCGVKNWLQASIWADVERDAGTRGNPTLQVGGEQEAVTDPDPDDGVERPHDSWHPLGADNTPGCEALQVRGMLVRTIPPLVFGKEEFPMTSVTTALAVSPV